MNYAGELPPSSRRPAYDCDLSDLTDLSEPFESLRDPGRLSDFERRPATPFAWVGFSLVTLGVLGVIAVMLVDAAALRSVGSPTRRGPFAVCECIVAVGSLASAVALKIDANRGAAQDGVATASIVAGLIIAALGATMLLLGHWS